MPEINYSPPPSLTKLYTEPKFYNILIGPIGSTKTTACIFFLLTRAMLQKPGPDGVARTRFAICRNTLVALKNTVLRDIIALLGPIVTWRPSENIIRINLPGDPKQGRPPVESEWFFLPLENLEDQRRLLSLQLSGVYVNEAREVPFDLITAASGRVNRFPRRADGGVTFPFILCDTNPPAVNSDLWEFVEVTKPDNLQFIRQPGAFDPAADWLEYLDPNYYNNLMTGASPEWVDVHVHGEYGEDPSGQLVFRGSFDINRHIYYPEEGRSDYLPIGPGTLIVGVDPGLNPAAVVTQLDQRGTIMVLRECYAIGAGTVDFINNHLQPLLASPELAGRPLVCVLDPAGLQRDANYRQSPYGLFTQHWPTRLAGTNLIQPRLNAIESMLLKTVADFQPGLLIDSAYCPVLTEALYRLYRYKRVKTTGQIEAEPMKLHPTSDVVDALGYACLGHLSPQVLANLRQANTFGSQSAKGRPQVPSLAWT